MMVVLRQGLKCSWSSLFGEVADLYLYGRMLVQCFEDDEARRVDHQADADCPPTLGLKQQAKCGRHLCESSLGSERSHWICLVSRATQAPYKKQPTDRSHAVISIPNRASPRLQYHTNVFLARNAERMISWPASHAALQEGILVQDLASRALRFGYQGWSRALRSLSGPCGGQVCRWVTTR